MLITYDEPGILYDDPRVTYDGVFTDAPGNFVPVRACKGISVFTQGRITNVVTRLSGISAYSATDSVAIKTMPLRLDVQRKRKMSISEISV